MGFPKWCIGVEKRLMNQLLRRKKKKKASLIDKKVCRESAKLHTGETSRLWSVVLDGG